ncbi:MAG: NfeD family protein [SAR324 cluster bacterium]|uniref:NfeD family protein n=1 Tax=SAR324 cluster bacterium TaxID=2024889 RepID=A0A7X9FQJ5_9DELT|nr:NfeD family protein [SAR324 cluster bacterium]
MLWWIWIISGIALALCEVILTPGVFVLLFFGISALVVGAMVAMGVGGPFWVQCVVFTLLAICMLAWFREKMRNMLGVKGQKMDFDSIVGGSAVARDELAPGASGKVEFRGSSWNAKNVGERILYPGDQCRIESMEGLLLSVKASD